MNATYGMFMEMPASELECMWEKVCDVARARDRLAQNASDQDVKWYMDHAQSPYGIGGLNPASARYAYADAMIKIRDSRSSTQVNMNHTMGMEVVKGWMVVKGRKSPEIISPILSFEEAEAFAKDHLKHRIPGMFGFSPISIVKVGP